MSSPGTHSARRAKSARRPARATASADIITPSFVARCTGTWLASYRAVAVAPGNRHVTFTPYTESSLRRARAKPRRYFLLLP